MSKGQRQQSYETFEKKNTIIQFWKITRKRYGSKSPFDKFLLKLLFKVFFTILSKAPLPPLLP